jgi:hypothetical protein
MAKNTVEQSLVLDVLDFARKGNLVEGASGTRRWVRGDQDAGGIGWQVAGGAVYLRYTKATAQGVVVDYSYRVPLAHTPAPYGGERVWFLCPRCGKRVLKLYLPPRQTHFLCRGCHGLSYAKRQKRRSAWKKVVDRMRKLEKELETPRLGSIRRIKALEEYRRLLDARRGMDCLEGLPPLKSNPVKRRPGRPSKQELRERAKARREAARATLVKRPRGRPKVKRTYTRRTPLLLSERKGDMEGYCVKCRDRRELKNPKPVTLSNGRPAIQGRCPVCHTKVTRIVKAGEGTPQG